MSDAPRTDREIELGMPQITHQGIVSADFARQLERELAAALVDARRFRLVQQGPRYGIVDLEGAPNLILQGTAFNKIYDAEIARIDAQLAREDKHD